MRFALVATLLALSAGCIGTNDDDGLTPGTDPDREGARVARQLPHGWLALTFEDGPSPYSRAIIEALDQRGLSAMFFWVGVNIEAHRDLLAFAQARGNQIGNHSYYHQRQVDLDEKTFKRRLRATKDNIGDHDSGQLYFRFPYGESSPDLRRWLAETRFEGQTYTSVGWDIDSGDWSFADQRAERAPDCGGERDPFDGDFVSWAQFAARRAGSGIMLFHDVRALTAEHIGEILDHLVDPAGYWRSLDETTRARYRAFYACHGVDADLAFALTTVDSGWPPH